MSGIHGGGDIGGRVADAHPASAEDVGRAHQNRVADGFRGGDGLVGPGRHRPRRDGDLELVAERAEPLAILGEVDRVLLRPEDRVPGLLERVRELQRSLAAELDGHAGRLLAGADLEHRLGVERLEVEPVRGVVVGRDRLGVAVHHHGLVAELAEALRRVDAAVVELDPLADAVRARAEDERDRLPLGRARLVGFAPRGVEVVGRGLDLGGAGVDPAVDRADAGGDPVRAHGRLVGRAGLGDGGVGEPEPLEREPVVLDEVVAAAHPLERVERAVELGAEPWMDAVRKVVGREPRRLARAVELAASHRLEERLGERAADPHRLPHGLHLRAQPRVGAGELVEGEARELHDDVVERRLEARGRRSRQVVRDLVERVADGELGRDLGDRIAGRLRRERGAAGDARVHLDHADVAGLALAGELDVRAAGLDADRPDDRGRGVAELLVGLVGERHLRRDRDRVARVHAHRVEVLDRADDHDVVVAVADHLELELVPAREVLLDEHLADRTLVERLVERRRKLLGRERDPAAVAAERERRAQHDREREAFRQLVAEAHDPRLRDAQAGRADGLAEELAVLGAGDHVDRRADELDAQLVQNPLLRKSQREVEGCLAPERRQERVRALAAQHVRDAFEVERLQVGAIREAGVGHDRRGVRVDDDRPESLGPQHLERLAAGVVELAGLADHDRARADQADRVEVRPLGQARVLPPSRR